MRCKKKKIFAGDTVKLQYYLEHSTLIVKYGNSLTFSQVLFFCCCWGSGFFFSLQSPQNEKLPWVLEKSEVVTRITIQSVLSK